MAVRLDPVEEPALLHQLDDELARLETVEAVLRDTTKIVTDGGGGNLTYLPLDRIIERGRAASAASESPSAQPGNENYVPAPADYAREREAARLRGSR